MGSGPSGEPPFTEEEAEDGNGGRRRGEDEGEEGPKGSQASLPKQHSHMRLSRLMVREMKASKLDGSSQDANSSLTWSLRP